MVAPTFAHGFFIARKRAPARPFFVAEFHEPVSPAGRRLAAGDHASLCRETASTFRKGLVRARSAWTFSQLRNKRKNNPAPRQQAGRIADVCAASEEPAPPPTPARRSRRPPPARGVEKPFIRRPIRQSFIDHAKMMRAITSDH